MHPHVLGQIPGRTGVFPGVARLFPSAKRLRADHGTGCRTPPSVRIDDAGLDVIEEVVKLIVVTAVDAGREPIVHIVRQTHGVLELPILLHAQDRDEQLLLEQFMVLGKVLHDGRLDVEAAFQVPFLDVLSSSNLPAVPLGDLDVLVEVLAGLACISGPRTVSFSLGSATLSDRTVFTSIFMKSLYTFSWTYSRESAEQLLAAEYVRAAHDAGYRHSQVCLVRYYARVLSTHLGDDRDRVSLRIHRDQFVTDVFEPVKAIPLI